jgi:hypothetical protein
VVGMELSKFDEPTHKIESGAWVSRRRRIRSTLKHQILIDATLAKIFAGIVTQVGLRSR